MYLHCNINNLKNVIKQQNKEEKDNCLTNLKNQHPQLYEFLLKQESFFDFFNNNELLTLVGNKM
jgi:hypothetical protein